MIFEQWLVEIEKIPYYNFLTEEEWEELQEKYRNFIKRKVILYLYRSNEQITFVCYVDLDTAIKVLKEYRNVDIGIFAGDFERVYREYAPFVIVRSVDEFLDYLK